VYEHGGPSEGIPLVDLSSKEDDDFLDTSWDEDFAKKLFNDLNHGLLGLPNGGNVIILGDSVEEGEVREEDTTNPEVAPPSV
jgi:hypothetical protein